jgi:phosphatidate cytidylyltransferase
LDPASPHPQPSQIGADLPLRIVSSLVMAPLAILAAYAGGWGFFAFWTAAAVLVAWEWETMSAGDAARPAFALAAIAVLAGALALKLGYPLGALAIIVIGIAAVAVVSPGGRRGWTGAGVFYAAAMVLPAVVLRADLSYGFVALLLLFAVVWGTDVAAYFGGRLIGGPKLWERVSPKKTWSGAATGTLAAVAAGVTLAAIANIGNLLAIGLLCALLSAASQAGDLFESAVKRHFGAKDSSHLIPGHGGLMDRLDGFVAAALLAALVGLARGGIEAPSRGLLIW